MSNQPIGRIRYYCKSEKKEYDVAAAFEPRNEKLRSWKADIAPEKRPDPTAQYPKLLLSDAAARAERGEGYLSYCKAKRPSAPRQPSGGDGGGDYGGGDFGDDDIPFRQFDERRA